MQTKGIYNVDGTPRGTNKVNRRRGIGAYQRNLTRANSLHNTALHWLDAGLNEARDANPSYRTSSPAVRKAKAALKAHVDKLRVWLPDCEQLRYFVGADDTLLPATAEQFDRNSDDVHDRRFFMYAGGKLRKNGQPYWERRPLKGGQARQNASGELVVPPVSPQQSLRLHFSPPCNFLFKGMLARGAARGREAFLDTQDLILTWPDEFQRDELPKFLQEWTGNYDENGEAVPLSAVELVDTVQHWDTGLPHVEVGVAELREISPEEAIEKGMPIRKPFGKALLKKLIKQDVDLPGRLMGRAFVLCGKPQLGRQGPGMVGLQILKRAGWQLQADQQAHYDSKIYRGAELRDYAQGLGIDTDLNDRFYTYCQRKAEALGLAKEWEAAEADYRNWLDEALPLKKELERVQRLAQLNFDHDQEAKGKQLRKLQVEEMRVQVQMELRDAGWDSKAMNALAAIHPLRKIAEAVLDGLGSLTIGRLGAAARMGFEYLVEFLRKIFENGFPSRVALAPMAEDPDVMAAIAKGVSEEAAKLKPIIKEIQVPGPVRYLEREETENERMWRETSELLRSNESIAQQAPLVKKAVGEYFTQSNFDFKSPFWMANRFAYGEQWAIVKAEVLRLRATRDAENAAKDRPAQGRTLVADAQGSTEPAMKERNRPTKSKSHTQRGDARPLEI